MLFHLGALWRLNEVGYLPKLQQVSSVSGGSITAAYLGLKWNSLNFDEKGVALSFESECVAGIRDVSRETIDVRAAVSKLWFGGSVAARVAGAYRKHLFGNATLQCLPDSPLFIFNATNLQSGALWVFSKEYMGDWRVGRVRNPNLPLAIAVAASSAFPPFLSPLKSVRNRTKTRSGGKRSPTTINRELSVLSKALTIAVKANVIRRNPCREVERFKADNARSRFLYEEEESRLYEVLGDHQMVKDVVTMALNTGMRQGEIFKLKWFDVDFTRGSIHVRRTKTGKDRFVPMNSRLRGLLESLNRSNEYVFPSPKTGVALIDVKRQFDKAKHAAGLSDFRFHDLRHTAATRMADDGASAFTIAAILGHSDIRMTSRYTHATDRATRAAVESLSGKSWSSFGQDLPKGNSATDVTY